jgi:hypothetical protein
LLVGGGTVGSLTTTTEYLRGRRRKGKEREREREEKGRLVRTPMSLQSTR